MSVPGVQGVQSVQGVAFGVHRVFAVAEASQVGAARRGAGEVASALGFDEVDAGRVALAATELATNLVKHAHGGRLLVAPVGQGANAAVELLSLDAGPGIADLARALADGFSSAGTPGQGLGAVRRLAREFDLHSTPRGSVVLARVAPRAAPAIGADGGGGGGGGGDGGGDDAPYEIGAVRIAAPGETACGDAWALAQAGGRAALLVADGLGHGPFAAEAADAATAAFAAAPFERPEQLLSRVHRALAGSRGAAVAVAACEPAAARLVFCGVGNIGARLVSGVADRSLLSQHGTAGVAVRTLQPFVIAWPERALLVMHSDGIASRWNLDDEPGLLLRHPATVAARLLARHGRGRDDATVVVLKPRMIAR